VAYIPEQPDLFDWKPEHSLFSRIAGVLKSERFFRIAFWTFFFPVLFLDNIALMEFIAKGKYPRHWLLPILVGLTSMFIAAYALKYPKVVLGKLRHLDLWILLFLLFLLGYRYYGSEPLEFLDSIREYWLFSLGTIIAVAIFFLIRKSSVIVDIFKSYLFWFFVTIDTLSLFLVAQPEIFAFFAKIWMVPVGFGLIAGSLYTIWKIPLWLTETLKTKKGAPEQSEFELEEKRLKMIDDTRKTVATVIGGLFVIIGAVFTYSNYELSSEGQVTNRFSTAVVLLKDDDSSVRLGGLYALERVAKDSPKDHSTIMEILAAYIRERSRIQKEKFERDKIAAANRPPAANALPEKAAINAGAANSNSEKNISVVTKIEDLPPPIDVLTACEIISRRNTENDKKEFSFNFSGVNLKGAHFIKTSLRDSYFVYADLRAALFFESDLTNASLTGASLEAAYFVQADLTSAELDLANLNSADLDSANLEYANLDDSDLSNARLNEAGLRKASMDGANLKGARLVATDLRGADLAGCKNLEFEQLSVAIIDEATILPPDLEPRRAELLQLSQDNLLKRKNKTVVYAGE